jgi:hybrid cluster-associated redox disulfide protein
MEKAMIVTKHDSINSILRAHPETLVVFIAHGMGCAGCMGSDTESLERGARLHGVSVEGLLADLNRAIAAPPAS